MSSSQHTEISQGEIETFVDRVHAEPRKGNSAPVPQRILSEIIAKAPDDYEPCDQNEKRKLAVGEISIGSSETHLLPIQGQGFCYCSATGNCSFWVYQRRNGKYRMILDTDMVQVFGFLKSHTHRYPDLVTWSHNSATSRTADLYRFDGRQYVQSGGWDEDYEYLSEDGQLIKPDKPRITPHFWGTDSIPK